jgi:Holliday junction resolvasome RuvABC endonuclease subunit
MRIILGLDISSSCIGVAVLKETSGKPEILSLDYIGFKGCDGFWQKIDRVKQYVDALQYEFSAVFIEDILKRFQPGMSSAGVIIGLARFNAVVSSVVRDHLKLDPEYIPSGEARRLCGMKLQQKKNCGGKSHKDQVFDQMCATDLKEIVWKTKKQNKKQFGKPPEPITEAKDMTDAYVIGKAGLRKLS